jgi:hypothetical protein
MDRANPGMGIRERQSETDPRNVPFSVLLFVRKAALL